MGLDLSASTECKDEISLSKALTSLWERRVDVTCAILIGFFICVCVCVWLDLFYKITAVMIENQ